MDYSVAYCFYFATGEGVTAMIAIAPTKERAEELYKQLDGSDHFTPTFASDIYEAFDGSITSVINWIPKAVRENLLRGRPVEFVMKYHLNMS